MFVNATALLLVEPAASKHNALPDKPSVTTPRNSAKGLRAAGMAGQRFKAYRWGLEILLATPRTSTAEA